MTLAELHACLASAFPPSMQKDLQTAVRVLAKALDCPDPQHCTPEHYHQALPSLYQRVETYLRAAGKGRHTVRNTKNNLSRLFRLAADHQVLTPCPPHPSPRFDPRTKPARPTASGLHSASGQSNGSYLPYACWPVALQQAFTDFAAWATDPLVPGRDASFKKRPSTIATYRRTFEPYFGFLAHQLQMVPTFEHLFDVACITQYVQWHVNEQHQRPTRLVQMFLQFVLALTRQYRPLFAVRAQLAALKKTLPTPPPVYHKEDAWVSLADLDAIGQAIWPGKHPTDLRSGGSPPPGLVDAARAGLALMFRLWTRIPFRQRNMREMRLGDNLRKDAQGAWRITFRGEQLKVAVKRGRVNIVDLRFPDTLVPMLDDYLGRWRPILLRKAAHPSEHVFLTKYGSLYRPTTLIRSCQDIVYRYTGKHWHPHIVRSVWASEWIRHTHGDFYKAAIMLNDRLETVIATYAHLLEEDVAVEAYRLVEERLSQGIYPLGH